MTLKKALALVLAKALLSLADNPKQKVKDVIESAAVETVADVVLGMAQGTLEEEGKK